MKKIIIFLMFIGSLLIVACQKYDENMAKKLVGYWQVEEALRNNRPTESVEGLYIEFTADGKMRTNLAGVTEEGTYQLKKDKILQQNTSMNVAYTVESIEDSNLVLTTQLSRAARTADFRFEFRKMSPSDIKSDTTENNLEEQ